MATAEQAVLEILKLLRSSLPPSTVLASDVRLSSEQTAILRAVIRKLVAASVISVTGGDLASAVAGITEALVSLIADDPSVLTPNAGTHLQGEIVQDGSMRGHLSVSFSGGGQMSANVEVGFDARGPQQTSWFKSDAFKQQLMAGIITSVVSTTLVGAGQFAVQQLDQQAVAISLVVTGDGVRVRLGPSFDAGVLAHLNKGTRALQTEQEGEWRHIISDSTAGWVHQDHLMKVD